ncbi:hypothetical protein R1sor_013404 [Riccia sorocarpa]|uniref:Uncharacterized protein n=1 Tax=Riccia sorocarpa TaxID=122646 RepID=A0ABD3HA01_9MARC
MPLANMTVHEEEELEAEAEQRAGMKEEMRQRHQMWAQIVAENLEHTRKNPAKDNPQPDIEYDLGELFEAIDDIIETSSPAGDNGELLVLDSKLLVAKVRKLQKQSFIIHTVDMWVTIDYFERWAAEEPYLRQLTVVHGEQDGILPTLGHPLHSRRPTN